MKRILGLLAVLFLTGSLCLAEETVTPAKSDTHALTASAPSGTMPKASMDEPKAMPTSGVMEKAATSDAAPAANTGIKLPEAMQAGTDKAVKVTAAVSAETKTLTGKVDSVSVADPMKGTKSEIVVVDDAGKKSNVLVKSTTTIYDESWHAVTLDKISKEAKVKVRYTTSKEGVEEALSISLMK